MQHTQQSDANNIAVEEAVEAEQQKNEKAAAIQAAIQARKATAEKVKSSMKPSAEGTVAEIAKKLGISKSEVRRRRRMGEM
jgi:response regulator of citrate/malate metabolism